jgi:CysZ protein
LTLFVRFSAFLVIPCLQTDTSSRREYSSLQALRFYSGPAARTLRTRNSGTGVRGRIADCVLLLVPFANILTPLFATALMVHLQKRLSGGEGAPAQVPAD